MDLATALEFAAPRTRGTLVTVRPDGSPHASNVLYALDGDVARVSLTDTRVKTRNLRHDPRCAMHVAGDTFWTYVVLEGVAELSPVAAQPDDPTVEALVELYQRLGGTHENWAEYRAAMVDERRLVMSLRVGRGYGQLPG